MPMDQEVHLLEFVNLIFAVMQKGGLCNIGAF